MPLEGLAQKRKTAPGVKIQPARIAPQLPDKRFVFASRVSILTSLPAALIEVYTSMRLRSAWCIAIILYKADSAHLIVFGVS